MLEVALTILVGVFAFGALLVFGFFVWAGVKRVNGDSSAEMRVTDRDRERDRERDRDRSDARFVTAVQDLNPEQRKRRLLLQEARKHCESEEANVGCCNCQQWNLDAGQDAIRSHPTFCVAAQHVSPNRMSASKVEVGADDKPIEETTDQKLPAHLDSWSLFGLCNIDQNLRHAIDKCENFDASRYRELAE